MAGVTYKCPSCGAYLAFNPDTQRWKCDFCGADFDEKTLLAKADEYARQARQAPEKPQAQPDGSSQVIYHCPSCGSEIITDETTVATSCYYCHNPVVLQGKLTADMTPDLVLPFTISKEKALEKFQSWLKSKRFIPRSFGGKRAEEMSGVYYPHFVTECEMDGSFEGEGRNISVADTPEYTVTSTRHYAVRRRGDVHFHHVMRPALQSTNRKLSDGIHPFPLDDLVPFSSAYLSGFLAERRDLDEQTATADVAKELEGYLEPLLTGDAHYDSLSGHATGKLLKQSSQYVLLPTWVLTYKGGGKEPYYYVMNGRTGAVCGKLPIDKGRLTVAAVLVGAAATAVLAVLSSFLW